MELGVGLLVVGARVARSRVRSARRTSTSERVVEASIVTAAGVLALTRADNERRYRPQKPAGHLHKYSITVDDVECGHVTALLDRGTDSAVIVPALERGDKGDSDDLVPGVMEATIMCLASRDPWVRRVSIALRSEDTAVARALRLRGFDCEGLVPGYVEDEPGTRRRFWTTMVDL